MKYTERMVEFGTDWPDPVVGEMVVVLKDAVPVMVSFVCPCGCGNLCPTHLRYTGYPRVNGFPRWDYTPGQVTLSPSIRWTGACKAHFNITNGDPVFHADSGK